MFNKELLIPPQKTQTLLNFSGIFLGDAGAQFDLIDPKDSSVVVSTTDIVDVIQKDENGNVGFAWNVGCAPEGYDPNISIYQENLVQLLLLIPDTYVDHTFYLHIYNNVIQCAPIMSTGNTGIEFYKVSPYTVQSTKPINFNSFKVPEDILNPTFAVYVSGYECI